MNRCAPASRDVCRGRRRPTRPFRAVCGRTDDEASFVLCDGCPRGGHYRCLGMPGVPTGDWLCPGCVETEVSASVAAGGVQVEDVIPDAGAGAPPEASPQKTDAPPKHAGSHAAPDVLNRQPLKLGVDVEERPMWGMDCYTRVAVMCALGQAKVRRRAGFSLESTVPA